MIANRKKARVLIVDDHPIVRKGLAGLIREEPDLEVCGEAADATEALALVEKLAPDLILVDLSLKSGHGIELIKQVKSVRPGIRLLVSSMHDESLYAERALRAGAMGYVNKQEATESIVEAIRRVLKGQIFLSPRMTERVLRRMVDTGGRIDRSAIEGLSDRELTVFECIGRGLTTRQIAESLSIGVKTVETYRESIKAKLHISNYAELSRHAVHWVIERG
jgi:DNA-binding NarL/FixJ family response regulator